MTTRKTIGIAALALGCAVLTSAAVAQEKAAPTAPVQVYEGKVQTGLGPYLYLPSAQGVDIALQGFDAATLVGKDVRVKGEMLTDKGTIFRADSVEEKSGAGYTPVYTRNGDLVVNDVVTLEGRAAYTALAIDNINKPEQWEGKGQAKVFGQLQDNVIVLRDDKGKETGRILVDSITPYAQYYVKKLRLFDRLWFYMNVKESVDKKLRAKNKELFHADVLFAGLF